MVRKWVGTSVSVMDVLSNVLCQPGIPLVIALCPRQSWDVAIVHIKIEFASLSLV